MKPLALIVTLFLLVVAAPPPALAQAPGQGVCTTAGSWKGETGGTSFLSTYAETAGSIAGTVDLDLWGDVTFSGAFPNAVRMTSGRGTWMAVTKKVADYHFLAIGLDAANVPVYQLKVSGRKTMADDCRSQTFTVTIAVYAPWQDPFGAEPPLFAGPMPGAPGTAVRLPFPSR